MAVSLLAVTSSGNVTGTGLTHSHAGGSGTDTLAVVAVLSANRTTSITVTYAGVSMNAVSGGDQNGLADTTGYRSKLFYLANPTSGTQNVVVTQGASSQKAVVVWTFQGVDQGTPIGGVDGAGTVNAPVSSASYGLTTNPGDTAILAARTSADTTALSPDSGDTEDRDADIGTGRGYATREDASGATTTVGWSSIVSRNHATVALVVKAAATGTIVATGVASDFAAGSHTLIDDKLIVGSGLASGLAIGSATVLNMTQILEMLGYDASGGIGSHSLVYAILAQAFDASGEPGTPTVSTTAVIATSGLASEFAIGSAQVIPGAVTVLPFGLDASGAAGILAVLPGGVNIVALGLPSEEAFGWHQLTGGVAGPDEVRAKSRFTIANTP